MATTAPPRPAETALQAWVREHEVCWEVDPYFEVHHHERVQLGFSVTLVARPPASARGFDPGSDACAAVFETLREIVERVVPAGVRFRIEPFDAAFHLRAETGWAPEVELTAEILHHEGTFTPLDAAERGQLALLVKRLTALGAQEQSWSGRRAAP